MKTCLISLGPKLPGNPSNESHQSATSPTNSAPLATKEENSAGSKPVYSLTAPTLSSISPTASTTADCNNSWAYHNGVTPTASTNTEENTRESPSSKSPAGPKINYTKDELGKYGDLAMMSQAYAKINQVSVVNFGSNGSTEINMVELENPMTPSVPNQQQQQQQIVTIADQPLQIINQHQLLQFQQEQQQQQNQVIKYHIQQRNIQLQLQNLQQLRANQQIQQLNSLHNLQIIQAQQALQAQQQQKQQIIALQLEQLNMLKQQHQLSIRNAQQQQFQVIQQLEARALELEVPESSFIVSEPEAAQESVEKLVDNNLQIEVENIFKDQESVETKNVFKSSQVETISEITSDEVALETSSNTIKAETNQESSLENNKTLPETFAEVNSASVQSKQQNQQDSNDAMSSAVIDSQPVVSQSPQINVSQQPQQQEYLVSGSPDKGIVQLSNQSINSNSPHSQSPLLVSHSPNFIHLQQHQQQQRLQYQPIQLTSLQNSGLIQLAGNPSLINFQQQQHHHPSPQLVLNQQLYEQPQSLTVLNAQQIAAIQQHQLQQQLQAQAQQHQLQQQLQIQAQQQQQLQFHQLQHAGLGGLSLQQGAFLQPQIIQLRPTLVAQPQFIVNNNQVPLYRILPQ